MPRWIISPMDTTGGLNGAINERTASRPGTGGSRPGSPRSSTCPPWMTHTRPGADPLYTSRLALVHGGARHLLALEAERETAWAEHTMRMHAHSFRKPRWVPPSENSLRPLSLRAQTARGGSYGGGGVPSSFSPRTDSPRVDPAATIKAERLAAIRREVEAQYYMTTPRRRKPIGSPRVDPLANRLPVPEAAPTPTPKKLSRKEVKSHMHNLADHIKTKYKLLQNAFRDADVDKSGFIDKAEFAQMVANFNLNMSEEAVLEIGSRCAGDDDMIDYREVNAAPLQIPTRPFLLAFPHASLEPTYAGR